MYEEGPPLQGGGDPLFFLRGNEGRHLEWYNGVLGPDSITDIRILPDPLLHILLTANTKPERESRVEV